VKDMVEPTTSLTDRVVPIEAGAPVTAAAFLGTAPALALGDGCILLGLPGAETRIAAHPDGAILVAALAGGCLVTGGDDGRVVVTSTDGTTREIAHEKGKWIDALAGRDDGALAWSAGRQVRARDAKGEIKAFTAPSTVRGLAFLPKGYRIAIAHYNGATFWFPNTSAAPEMFDWKGSHLDITVSPDGRFVVTSMQENALHGWRIADHKDMRMSGYPAKTRSFSWSFDGHWLVTSGADAAIAWPFKDKDGPMQKDPLELGVRHAKVTYVACHPKAPVVAQGYDDGCILLCRLTDGAEILARPSADAAVTALAWDKAGQRLLFGTADGGAGLLTMPV
jgi:WD40 repeat protein